MNKWIFILALLMSQTVFAGWGVLKPVRSVGVKGRLGDIYSHLDTNMAQTYMDADLVTSGHECTHGINSRIRNELGVKNGYYMLNDRVFTIGQCPIKLSALARAIPQDKRGSIYDLYLVNAQQWWDDDALYICDELISYINGSLVGLEVDMEFRSLDSYNHALEMRSYLAVLQPMCKQANFNEQKELDEFVVKIDNGIKYLGAEYKKRNWINGPKLHSRCFNLQSR